MVSYNSDSNIPMYGFGASENTVKKLGGNQDCFPMNGNNTDASVEGVEGLMKTYLDCRQMV